MGTKVAQTAKIEASLARIRPPIVQTTLALLDQQSSFSDDAKRSIEAVEVVRRE
jgi:hypothetical protein